MNLKTTIVTTNFEKTPIVARFSTIRYDEVEEPEEVTGVYATTAMELYFDTSKPSTYSHTTRSGRDRDKDDKGSD